jgi:hypothetical protein
MPAVHRERRSIPIFRGSGKIFEGIGRAFSQACLNGDHSPQESPLFRKLEVVMKTKLSLIIASLIGVSESENVL